MPLLEGHVFAQSTIVFAVIGLLALLLRWTFRRDAPQHAPGHVAGAIDDYGLLQVAAHASSAGQADQIRFALAEAGVRATRARDRDGHHLVLVFPADLDRARRVMDGPDLALS